MSLFELNCAPCEIEAMSPAELARAKGYYDKIEAERKLDEELTRRLDEEWEREMEGEDDEDFDPDPYL